MSKYKDIWILNISYFLAVLLDLSFATSYDSHFQHHGRLLPSGRFNEQGCDIPERFQITCGTLTEYQCKLAGCCLGEGPNKCYTDIRLLTSGENHEDHPCLRLPPNCEVMDRTPCDLRGQKCGIGILTELRKCTDEYGVVEARYTHRLCCNPQKMCTENTAVQVVMCANIYPECEPSLRNYSNRLRRDVDEDDMSMCDSVSCGPFLREECEYVGCLYDPRRRQDKCYTSGSSPPPLVTEYPCKKLPDNCQFVSRTPCDLRDKSCGIGILTETRRCTDSNGITTTQDVPRMCCIPGQHCTGTGPSPFVMCANVFPDCERPGWNLIHSPVPAPNSRRRRSLNPACDRVPCRSYRNPECEYSGCIFDPEARFKCYTYRQDPPPTITDYPCKKLPDNCELVSRTACDLKGKKCGIGTLTETRRCTNSDGNTDVSEVGRLCCIPSMKCTGTAPAPILICADVFPECEQVTATRARRSLNRKWFHDL